MSANALLLWMSARREGSWQQFRSAVEELHIETDTFASAEDDEAADNFRFPLYQALRLNLQRLGHAEFFGGADLRMAGLSSLSCRNSPGTGLDRHPRRRQDRPNYFSEFLRLARRAPYRRYHFPNVRIRFLFVLATRRCSPRLRNNRACTYSVTHQPRYWPVFRPSMIHPFVSHFLCRSVRIGRLTNSHRVNLDGDAPREKTPIYRRAASSAFL